MQKNRNITFAAVRLTVVMNQRLVTVVPVTRRTYARSSLSAERYQCWANTKHNNVARAGSD